MRRIGCYSLFVCLAFSGQAPASDLTAIERTIRKEPAYQSKNPQYCLLVFGPKVETRVWVVLDGDVLYVDRNGNGDLTDPGEKIAAETALHRPEIRADVEVLRVFQIAIGGLKTSGGDSTSILSCAPDVGWFYVMQLIPRDDWPQRVWADHWKAKPFDVAVNTSANLGQRAQVRFADRAQDAPIVHFGGPLQLALSDKFGPLVLRRGESSYVTLNLTTPGLHSVVKTDHDSVPEGIHPIVDLELPPTSPGGKPIHLHFELPERC